MFPAQDRSFRLFAFSGIQVYLHWSWFLVAIYELMVRRERYTSPVWNVAEYLALFGIVLLHEFGHSLACRQVGGRADEIVLWPFGGIAFLATPQRPGATLWSVAAGPLVNVVLAPVLFGVTWLAKTQGLLEPYPNLDNFLYDVQRLNLMLLIFNLLPIYPLDGGQILRSLLWYLTGPATSLLVATVIGFVGIAGLAVLALLRQSVFTGLVAFFLFSSCLAGFNRARAMRGGG
ncbi:MAG: M50 family metallopeptidase [Opitutaceae bacterium]|nr:M50 family metallopeptidase [Opitutaceae bacterium]